MRGATHFKMRVEEIWLLVKESFMKVNQEKSKWKELKKLKGQTLTGERQRPGSETDCKKAEQLGEEEKQTHKT